MRVTTRVVRTIPLRQMHSIDSDFVSQAISLTAFDNALF
jgi:hypothetical protein